MSTAAQQAAAQQAAQAAAAQGQPAAQQQAAAQAAAVAAGANAADAAQLAAAAAAPTATGAPATPATGAPGANQGFAPGGAAPGGVSGLEQFGPFGFATSPFQRGNIISDAGGTGNIILGPHLAQIFNVDPNTSLSMSTLLDDLARLSADQMTQLQSVLAQAGMFVDASGAPMANPPTTGAHDDQTYTAFGNALLQTLMVGQGSSVEDTLNNRMGQGLGQANQAAAVGSPVVQGGQAYQINLSNPAAAPQQINAIFQAGMGRNATQAEIARIVAEVGGQETTYQSAQNQQRESASQAMYQATISGRQAQNAPKPTSGPVPNGPFKDVYQWAAAFLQYVGAANPNGPTALVTPSNIAMIVAWANSTGQGMSGNNPLGVTLAQLGSTQTQGGTAQSAQKYAQPADGMRAALQTLNGGNFAALLGALQSGDGSGWLSHPDVQAQLAQWTGAKTGDLTKQAQALSGPAAAAAAQYGAAPTPAPPPPQPVPAAAVDTSQEAKLSQANANVAQTQAASTAYQGTPQGALAAASNTPAVAATLTAGNTDPAVGAYLTAGYNAAHGLGSQAQPVGDIQGQQAVPPGSMYVQPTTLTQNAPLTYDQAAYQDETTGPNRIAYAANNYLELFKSLMSFIQQGGFK